MLQIRLSLQTAALIQPRMDLPKVGLPTALLPTSDPPPLPTHAPEQINSYVDVQSKRKHEDEMDRVLCEVFQRPVGTVVPREPLTIPVSIRKKGQNMKGEQRTLMDIASTTALLSL